ncbi:hypothetical protein GCM10027074_51030 [Streptomyces deserti]
MKRAALAATALSLLSLTTLTACGGDADPDKATGEPRPTTSGAKQVTPAERLAKLMITKADLSGPDVTPTSSEDDEYAFAKSPDDMTVDKPACTPLAYAMNQFPLGESQADLTHYASEGLGNGFTYITLATYDDPGKAESAFAGLSEAVDACGGGFTAKANGTSTIGSVTAEKPVAPAGDESLGFRSTLTSRGVTHAMHAQAVRSGDVVAVYFSVNGSAMAAGRPSDMKLPPEVVKAQNAKLG